LFGLHPSSRRVQDDAKEGDFQAAAMLCDSVPCHHISNTYRRALLCPAPKNSEVELQARERDCLRGQEPVVGVAQVK
jgi:hypothetical protein